MGATGPSSGMDPLQCPLPQAVWHRSSAALRPLLCQWVAGIVGELWLGFPVKIYRELLEILESTPLNEEAKPILEAVTESLART